MEFRPVATSPIFDSLRSSFFVSPWGRTCPARAVASEAPRGSPLLIPAVGPTSRTVVAG